MPESISMVYSSPATIEKAVEMSEWVLVALARASTGVVLHYLKVLLFVII